MGSILADRFFNANLRDKAYLIEFYNGNVLEQSFSFCLPAQNEQITSPQKVYETKTYDGSVIDDYGNDIEQVNLSGSTYNTEVRLIYAGPGTTKSVTGEQEIFKLRELLRNYGKNYKLINKHVFLYDLSSPEFKYWEVFPKELRIERSKDSPFAYNYSFNLLAAESTGILGNKNLNWLQKFVKSFNDFKEKVMSYTEVLLVGMVYFDQALDYINVIKDVVNQTEDVINTYIDITNGYANIAAKVMNETVGLGDYVVKSPLRIYSMGISVFNSTKKLLESCNNLKNWCRNLGDDFKKSADAINKQYNASVDEIKDEWNVLTNQICRGAEEVHAASIMATTNNGVVTMPGGEDDDTIKLTYGFKEKTLKDGDTWDNIAFETYGDSSLGILLASYNGTLTEESSSEIVPGKTVYIPILDEVKSTSNNEVYNEPGVIDNYGKDIEIQNGDFGEQNGDLAIVNGLNNLTQAILFRLCTSINNRIRNTVYGIKSSVGYSVAIANKYLASSITQTVLTDPRVSEIQSLQWEGSGSELKINFSYTDINDQNQSYGGE